MILSQMTSSVFKSKPIKSLFMALHTLAQR
jgi:hypothetical protein